MFDHYIAVDWAQTNMAIARMTNGTEKIVTIDVPSNVKELQLYLTRLKGKKILTFEETTPSHWLYTELKEFADEILVCDPYRNHLLSEGPKNDRIDAEKHATRRNLKNSTSNTKLSGIWKVCQGLGL